MESALPKMGSLSSINKSLQNNTKYVRNYVYYSLTTNHVVRANIALRYATYTFTPFSSGDREEVVNSLDTDI